MSRPAPDRLCPPHAARGRTIQIGLALTLLVGACFAATFRGAWVYDDFPGILENGTIRHLATGLMAPLDSGSPVSGRPLVNLSLAFDYAVSGGNAWSYHLTNVALHLAVTLLLFGVVRCTLDQWRRTRGESVVGSARLGFAVAALWAVHPLVTEAVTYTVQRAESLMALFYLLTLYAFIRSTDGVGHRLWATISVVGCAAGMASKEVMASAPLVVLLYDRTFIAGGFRAALSRRRNYYLGLAATWMILVALVAANRGRGGTAGFDVAATWWSYGLAQLHAVLLYVKLAVWPHPLVFDYGVDAIPLPGPDLLCALGVGAMLGLTAWGLWRRPVVGFFGAAFFAILAPTSSVLPIVTEPVAEHRMYLPLALVIAAGVVAAYRLLSWRVYLLGGMACAALALQTWRREEVYRSERGVWSDTVTKVPRNARAHYNLARTLDQAGDRAAAIRHYRAALAIRPAFPSAHTNLSNLLAQTGDVAGAREHAEQALRYAPHLAAAHNNLATALLLSGDVESALREYQTAVQEDPGDPDFHSNLGTALSRVNRLSEAAAQYEAALALRPDAPGLHFNLANVWARMGEFDRAIAEYDVTLRLDPGYPRAAENRARVEALRAGRR